MRCTLAGYDAGAGHRWGRGPAHSQSGGILPARVEASRLQAPPDAWAFSHSDARGGRERWEHYQGEDKSSAETHWGCRKSHGTHPPLGQDNRACLMTQEEGFYTAYVRDTTESATGGSVNEGTSEALDTFVSMKQLEIAV